jgi:hypothetical protein
MAGASKPDSGVSVLSLMALHCSGKSSGITKATRTGAKSSAYGTREAALDFHAVVAAALVRGDKIDGLSSVGAA